MIDFEDEFFRRPDAQAYPYRKKVRWSEPRRVPTKRQIRDDPEMGFLPLLAAAVPAVASLAGSLLSKKSSKGGGPPPEATQAQNVLGILTQALGGDQSQGENTIKEVVRNVVSSVPSPVMAQVKKAITELKNADKAKIESRGQLVNAVDSKFGPQIHAMLAGLKAAQIQRQATDEHNRIKAKEMFRKATTESLLNLGKRLENIERRLDGSAIVSGARLDMYGGRNILERR